MLICNYYVCYFVLLNHDDMTVLSGLRLHLDTAIDRFSDYLIEVRDDLPIMVLVLGARDVFTNTAQLQRQVLNALQTLSKSTHHRLLVVSTLKICFSMSEKWKLIKWSTP